MTNFEWLVKTNKLQEFLFDLKAGKMNDEPTLIGKKYPNLIIEWGDTISFKCAEWLQAEYKENTYIKKQEVLEIFRETTLILPTKQKNAEEYFMDYINKVIQRILKLPTKEIDE